MLLGGIFVGGIAIHFGDASGWWTLPLMMLGVIVGGMLWAAIPALLKSCFNTNEILTSLMLTYVATQRLIYLVSGPWRDPEGMNFPISEMFVDDALFPRLYGDWHWSFLKGTRINASVFLTVIAIPCIWLFMRKSFAGFRMNVGGLAPLAARYAGFSTKRPSGPCCCSRAASRASLAWGGGRLIGQLQAGWAGRRVTASRRSSSCSWDACILSVSCWPAF